jgi:hypothetical protein
MGHHSNTLAPHPLVSDGIQAWFCINVDVAIINENYNKKNKTKPLVRAFTQVLQRIASFRKDDKGEITWR